MTLLRPCPAPFKRLATALLTLLCLLPLLATEVAAQGYAWRNVEAGGGGFVTGTVFHPTEPGLVYARTDVGGIYRLDSVTGRWTPLNDEIGGLNNEFQHLGVLTIGVDPSDANRLYIATGQYGGTESWKLPSRIYRSTNRGSTWTGYTTPGFKMAGNGEGRGTGERFAVNPTNGSILLVGTSNDGIWRSTDYGVTWSKTSFAPTTTNYLIYAPAVTPGPGPARRLYAAANSLTVASLWQSDDNGTTWTETPGQPGRVAGSEMMSLMGSFDAAGVFYSTWGDQTGPGNYQNRYVVSKLSADRTTWTSITPPTGQGGFAGVSADPRVAGHVVVTTIHRWYPGDEVYRSTDGGASWTAILRSATRSTGTSPWSSSAGPHWMTDIDIDPFDSNRAIFNTGFGLFATTNLSTSGTARIWTFFNNGLEELVPLALLSPTAGPPLISVTGDYTGFRHDNINRSPQRGRLSPGNGSNNRVTGAPLAASRMIRQNGTDTLYSTDAGATWAAFPSSPPAIINDCGRIELSADGQRLIWCPLNAPAYYSTDQGATWTVAPSSASISSGSTLTVSVLAGAAGVAGTTNSGGGNARFNAPAAIAVGTTGIRYVADTANHLIRVVGLAEGVTTLAGGAGVSGSTNATGTAARFNAPAGIVVSGGAIYVADTGNHLIRKITTAGVVTTFAGQAGVAGALDGTGTAATFNAPGNLAADASGNLYVADTGNHLIRKITAAGVVSTVAGTAGVAGALDSLGTAASFNAPRGIALDVAGNLFVADTGNHVIRRVALDGTVTTFAGTAGLSGTTNATGAAARFNAPEAIVCDGAGILHVADTGNHTLRRITTAGVVTTVAGSAGVSGSASGSGTTARFLSPRGLASDRDGFSLYVADTGNHLIRSATAYASLVPITDTVDPLRVYLWDTSVKRLFTSADGGVTYTVASSGLPSGFSRFRSAPGKTGHLWVSAGGSGFYQSTNTGSSFTKLTSIAEVYQFAFGCGAAGSSYPAIYVWGKVGTTVGFYRSDNAGATWTRINDNLHQFGYQNDMAADMRTYGRVYLATSGRGVIVGEPATPPTVAALPSEVIYGDALRAGWTNTSPSGTGLGSTSAVRRGTNAIAVASGSGRGVSFTTAARTTSGFSAVSFWVHGGTVAAPPLQVGGARGGIALEAYPVTVASVVGWQRIVVPLVDLGLDRIDDLTGLRIESRTVNSVTPGAFSVDDITLVGDADYPLLDTPVTITLGNLTALYNGTPRPVSVTTTPAGRSVVVTYNGSTTAPSAVGSYAVVATLNDPFTEATTTGTLVISTAPAQVTLGDLIATADGTSKTPSVVTSPAGLAVSLTYNGSPTAPVLAGSYAVVATINDPTYQGSATATFVIRQPALAPTDITGWTSNISGKVVVNPATPSSPLLTPDDTSDSFSTNTLQASFSPITLVNPGDKITLTGTLQLTLAGVSAQGNWFRFGLFDQRGQAPNIATGWLGLTAMAMATPVSVYERVGTTGPFSSGTGAIARTADTSPAAIGSTSPSGTPPLSFVAEITRTAGGIVATYLVERTDTTPATKLLSFSYTDTTPNNNGTVSSTNTSNSTPTGYNPTFTTAGFAFGRTYIATTGAKAQFNSLRVAFTPGDTLTAQYITFPPLSDVAFSPTPVALDATASSGLPVSYTVVSGPATVDGSTLILTGLGTVTVRASQAGDATYSAAATVTRSFAVGQGSALVTLGALSATYDGFAKPVTVDTTPAGLAVSLSYDGQPTAPSAAGSYEVVATVEDPRYVGSATGTLTIAKAPQTITFAALPARTFGDAPFALTASSNSGLPVSFEIASGPAALDGNLVTLTGAGSVVVRALQAGDANRLPAPAVEQSFTVAKATAGVSLGGLNTQFDGQPKTVTVATTPSGLAATVTYNGALTPPSAVGSYAVLATIEDGNYAGSASGTLVIERRSFTYPVTGWRTTTANTTSIANAATSSPLLNSANGAGTAGPSVPFYAFFSPITLGSVGDTLTLTCDATVNAPAGIAGIGLWFRYGLYDNRDQAATVTSNWLGYSIMAQSTAGNSFHERIGGTGAGDFASSIFGTISRTLDASPVFAGANSPAGVVTLRVTETITRTATGVTVASRLFTPGTGGAADVVYHSGTYTDTTPNNNGQAGGASQGTPTTPIYSPRYNAIGFVFSGGYLNSTNTSSVQFTDVRVVHTPGTDGTAQTITFAPLPDRTYNDAPFSLSATASSGLPVSFTVVSGPATLNGPTLTLTGAGPVTIRATQAGNVTYLPATAVEQTFQVAKAPASITLTDLTAVYDGSQKSVTATTVPAGLTVEITYDGQTTEPTAIGSYAISAVIVDPLYAGEANGTLLIQAIPQSITFAPLPDRTYGDAPFALSASSTSGLPVEFSVLDGPAAIADGVVTLTGAGSVTVRAAQAGGANYAPAAPVEQTFTVAKASASVLLNGFAATYDGTPKPVGATTEPSGLAVVVTYDGSPSAPAAAGTYAVLATITDANYEGSASGSLVITSPFVIPPTTISVSGADVVLTVPSLLGFSYQLQSCSNLTTGVWTDVGTARVGTGAPLVFTDPTIPGTAARFYRFAINPLVP